ncbi:autophagy-related protein 2 homolog B-like [Diadema antillarum]|uniref:autophagy-related protein 2 homolog B-like n=1 Tax=Diadema antillarum TaxID=105358 RepID=UPI003A87AD7A
MPWYFPWPDYIKKKACRYLLQRYVGNFLEEKLTLDQLTVDIYSGTGTVKDVKLDVWVLNELLETCGTPVEIRDGSVGSISVEIPWSSLLTASSKVEIRGLQLTIQPKYRNEEASPEGTGSISDSMWSSMSLSSSMMLAQECLKQEPTEGEQEAGSTQPFEGPELLAQTIESVLMRVEVTLIDTVVRLEHVPQGSSTGIALEVHIERLRFFDEEAQGAAARDLGSSVDPSQPPRFEPAAFLNKNLQMMGVTIRCEEFPEQQRQAAWVASSSVSPSSPVAMENVGVAADVTVGGPHPAMEQSTFLNAASSPEMPPQHHRVMDALNDPRSTNSPADLLGSCLVGECAGKQELKVTVKQNEHVAGPKAEVDIHLASINFFLSPKQVHLLTELFSGFLSPATSDVATVRGRQPNKVMQAEDYKRIETDLQEHHLSEHHLRQEDRLRKESWGLRGVGEEDDDDDADLAFHPSLDGDEVFFSMTGSTMSLSTYANSNDMESSISSSISSCSTDTSRTGSGVTRLSYGSTLYRGPGASPMATAMQRPSANRKQRHKKAGYPDHLDDASEMTRYKIRFRSITTTILHEDPSSPPIVSASKNLSSSSSSSTLPTATPSSSRTTLGGGVTREEVLSQRAGDFFHLLGRAVFLPKDKAEWNERFEAACPYDHLRLIASPFKLECECKMNNHWNVTLVEMSVGNVDLQECLFSRGSAGQAGGLPSLAPPAAEHIQILSISSASSEEGGPVPRPGIRTKLKHLQRIRNQSSKRRQMVKPTLDVNVELGTVSCEVDMSLVDRLYTLLHPQPTYAYDTSGPHTYCSMQANTSLNKQAFFKQALDDMPSGSDLQTSICVTCMSAEVALRFPIPDLRRMSEVAWWRRSLRSEVLLVEITEAEFNTSLRDSRSSQKFLTKAREVKASLKLQPDDKPVPFLKVSEGRPDGSCNSDRTFNWPRLLVIVNPAIQPSILEEDQEARLSGPDTPTNGHLSWENGSFYHQEDKEPSPFSSKKVMYESEQMVMPGDQEEIRDFVKKTTSNSRLVLELNIPRVNILLESKDFLETLYNRFANDMLLWQPTAPTPRDPLESNYPSYGLGSGGLDLATQLAGSSMAESFGMCKSGLQFDSDSDEEEPDSLQFFSVYDHGSSSFLKHQRSSRHGGHAEARTSSQHYLSLTLNISHGKLTMGMPVKHPDGTPNEDVHGECLLEIEEGSLFTVTAYKGDENESYLSVQANRIALYHNGCVPHPFNEPLDSSSLAAPPHMKCCVYLSDDGVSTKAVGSVGKGGNSQHMVAIALRNSFDPVGNVKSAECAVAVRGATLRYYPGRPEHHWITQIGDFFDVVDEQILGYEMPGVVTQLHAHFWGCGVDYRPIHLPLKSFVLLESLSISSNLVYEAKESLLRFLIDDAALYISEKCNESKVNLKRDYVSVVDVGMLELSLRLSNDEEKNPKLDLKVSNNKVHLRTCADSCSALAQLLLYVSSDGDFATYSESSRADQDVQPVAVTVKEDSSPKQTKSGSPVSHTHSDQMRQLMEEAMKEITGDSPSPDASPKDHVVHIMCTQKSDSEPEIFLFPDEDEGLEDEDDVDILVDTSSPELRPASNRLSSESGGSWAEPDGIFDDEEFCVLDDPGMGVLRTSGEPEVKLLDQDPVTVDQDHFAPPISRGDQLNAPLDFPTPTMRYTLQEMTVVWHIYGGYDLQSTGTTQSILRPASRTSSPAHGLDKTRQQAGSGSSSPLRRTSDKPSHNVANMRWQERGGPGRDHSVLMELQMNKVRFRHETYPTDTKQSSRQILLVNDIEVRDRLAQSQINKFLYLYSSEARPKRTHANMVLVKALHIRPDPEVDMEECCLRISLQPLRFNIDQDALFFLRDFFTEVSAKATQVPIPDVKPVSASPSKKPSRVKIADTPPQIIPSDPSSQSKPLVNGHQTEGSPSRGGAPSDGKSQAAASSAVPAQPVFFRSFVFSPDVLIKLDYEGKHVDMEQGTLFGLLVGLGQLNHSELTLRRLHHRHGLLGVDRLLLYAFNEWAQDIKKSQLPRVLGGVGPMHSFVQLFQGMFDLLRLPVEQYKRDGRIVRGIQRGANSFGTSTAMAVVELTNRFVKLLQVAAETAYDVVSPGPSVSNRAITYGPFGQQRLARQPADLREGMANAINVVREGLGDTATAIMQTAMEEHEHKGVSGAVGGILRQIPPSVIRPLILATEATSSVLGGVRNQMLPDARKEDAEKWRSHAK